MRAVAVGLAAAALPAVLATGAEAQVLVRSPLLWATVNVCDTPANPDTIGIRASMPGSGQKRERLYMRFQVQYFKASTGTWAAGDATADSGFKLVGSARYRRRESGWNFSITPPPAGQEYRLRGVVTFEWRRGTRVVRRAKQRTHSGHPGTTGSDPRGFSAAECVITP